MSGSLHGTRQRSQFSVFAILVATTWCGVLFAFMRSQEFSLGSVLAGAVLSLFPLSIAIERFSQGPAASRSCDVRGWIKGCLFLAACSCIALGLCALWLMTEWTWCPLALYVAVMLAQSIADRDVMVIFLPALTFAATHAYLACYDTPQPIRLRVPLLLGLFTILNLVYLAFDFPSAIAERSPPLVFAVLLVNLGSLVGIWLYWLRYRQMATHRVAATLAIALHCWIFIVAFPTLGYTLVHAFWRLELNFSGPAPEVDPELWAQMKVGLTKDDVKQLLGAVGFQSGGGTIQFNNGPPLKLPVMWQYHWHSDPFWGPDDRAYVVWFDDQGVVTQFREPQVLPADEDNAP